MNVAKDGRSQNILGYLEGKDRATHVARNRFNTEITVKMTPEMKREVQFFAEKHGINRSEAVRAMIQRAITALDRELTQKRKNLAR